ncbi:MFS transporter [Viridibacillus sp. YIM B01967]|uniref:MFS transporter n=1 Tax=Viridibacillus soli TaxID=2798301 RepID=A0ABS1HAK9_9BACL|nr:MFS transporter [Viridibacillus soli]MBK3496471.1 MFS transporter [Viridibacillus soli]
MKFKKTMFKNKNLVIVFTSQLIFQLALWIGLIGNLQFLQKNVDSHLLQSILLVAGSVFSVLIGPYAGRLIDGIAKRKILLIVGILRMMSVGFMFVALATDSVWWMLAYSVGVSCSASFFEPALQAIIVEITDEKDLIVANSLNLNIVTLSRIFGATIGGLIISVASLSFLYTISFVAFLFVFIITFSLKIKDDGFIRRKKKKIEFKEVFPVISQRFDVKMILFLSVIPTIFIAGFNLFIVEISSIQNNPSIKGILYAVEGISLILSSTFISKRIKNKNRIFCLLVSTFLIVIVQFSLSLSSMFLFTIFAFGLFGFSYGVFNPIFNTLCQETIPNEYHGRFFAFKSMIDRTLIQISMVTIGLLLDVIGFEKVVITFGFISLILVLIFTFLYISKERSNYKSKESSRTLN